MEADMSDQRYSEFKAFVNLCNMPCAVLAVEKTPDGKCQDIKMIATNSLFSMTGEDVEGKSYTEKLPKDQRFRCLRIFLSARLYPWSPG